MVILQSILHSIHRIRIFWIWLISIESWFSLPCNVFWFRSWSNGFFILQTIKTGLSFSIWWITYGLQLSMINILLWIWIKGLICSPITEKLMFQAFDLVFFHLQVYWMDILVICLPIAMKENGFLEGNIIFSILHLLIKIKLTIISVVLIL